MDIYEKIRYYREHTNFSQRNVAKILGISRNTVKKYWEGQTVPWERKPGSGRECEKKSVKNNPSMIEYK